MIREFDDDLMKSSNSGGNSNIASMKSTIGMNRKDFDSISTLPPYNTENNQTYFDIDERRNTGEIVDFRSLSQELSYIRNSQNMIFREIEKLRNDLKGSKKDYQSPSSRILQSSSNSFTSSSPPSSSSSSSSSLGDNDSDASKYKDLKKKLLLANLRIMDLQNKQGL